MEESRTSSHNGMEVSAAESKEEVRLMHNNDCNLKKCSFWSLIIFYLLFLLTLPGGHRRTSSGAPSQQCEGGGGGSRRL
jgi:hypothetical protein